jgi:hypothetical protein
MRETLCSLTLDVPFLKFYEDLARDRLDGCSDPSELILDGFLGGL